MCGDGAPASIGDDADQAKGGPMYRKIVVGYDGSDQAKDALALGTQLAEATGAELVLAGVFQFDPMWGGADPRFRDADVEFTQTIKQAAAAIGARAEAVPSSSPARGLHDLAQEIDADLILVGSAHDGHLGHNRPGSTGVALLHGSPCAVGIAPRGYRPHRSDETAVVAVGFDGSAESREALTAAIGLASDAGAKLKLISVAVPPPIGTGKGGAGAWHTLLEAVEQELREQLAEARALVPDGVEWEASMVSGDPVDALASVSSVPGTILVVGSRAYGPLRRVLLGSVATSLLGAARCPVIVTPRGMHEPEEAAAAAAAETAS
jgi:nucleotide-binding universal stress UspA family protein